MGRRAIAIKGDVAVEADVQRMFETAETELGPLSALVNSAGVSHHNRVENLTEQDLLKMFHTNAVGLMLCCKEAIRRMSTKNNGTGGAIVNISSMAATNGGRIGHSTYAASKAAVDVFTMGFAKEVAAEGVRVNVVRPGVTDTDMIQYMRAGPQRRFVEDTIPMNRYAKPEEVAEAVSWLISDKASFVTGAHLNVSGGGFHIGAPTFQPPDNT